jgi:uncharacterized Zn-binding protein involved in type VI secretion
MARIGIIVNGCADVQVEGKPVARKTDVIDHAAQIGEGCDTVLAGGAAQPVARIGDRFLCPLTEPNGEPHVGGTIVMGAATVIVGGKPATRLADVTACVVGAGAAGNLFAGLGGGAMSLGDEGPEGCRALWDKYDRQAREIIAPADNDHRKRNHLINGAYAKLYLDDKTLKWAGLAAYASKQVGCAIDHARRIEAKSHNPAAKKMASYTHESLGANNRALFLDIYPLHRFYQEHGLAKLRECAAERNPPVPAAAVDGFAALDKYKQTGDRKYLDAHVRAIAWHEQVSILQRGVYNDHTMRRILDLNEGNVEVPVDDIGTGKPFKKPGPPVFVGYDPRGRLGGAHKWFGAQPADVVMTDKCEDDASKRHTIPFKAKGRKGHLYDVRERMDWILHDIAGYYHDHEGTPAHREHLKNLTKTGEAHGGHYP